MAKHFVGFRRDMVEVIARAGSDINGTALWLCRCKCGNTVYFNSVQLDQKKKLNCGCERRAVKRKPIKVKEHKEPPIFDGRIDDLRAGITLQAVHDYRKALQTLLSSKKKDKLERAQWTIDECEQFFTSSWGNFCTFGYGRKIMEQIKSEVRGNG